MPDHPQRNPRQKRNDSLVAFGICAVFAAMLALTFASAELYSLFCKATGYNGTTQIAARAPGSLGRRSLKVRFDSNVAPGLPWRFEPETPEIELKTGETAEIHYTIRNISSRETSGIAAYNVQPDIVGGYFNKIQCFCFTEQTLKPGEVREETVVFFVDPALESDRDLDGIGAITLSYTFAAVKTAPKPLAVVGTGAKVQ